MALPSTAMTLNCEQMQTAEKAAFARGVSAESLMDCAGRQIADAVRQFHPVPGVCVAYCGKGHNAGDALVAIRHLREAGWRVAVKLVYPKENLAELTRKKLDALDDVSTELPEKFLTTGMPRVLLDGLLGIGARGALHDPLAATVKEINHLRKKCAAFTVALDIPTGLDSETGVPGQPAVEADLTTTIAFAKTCLLADTAINSVGRLAVLPLPELTASTGDNTEVATPDLLAGWLHRRTFDTHKGMCGRLGIVAGSRGFLGAARLCSAAGVHGGAGLITLYVTEDIYPLAAASCIPEVMVRPVASYRDILEDKLDALAIGPGIGFSHAGEISFLIQNASAPMVVDADALTLLSKEISLLKHCAGLRLLTPHPGEMERLNPCAGRSRRQWAEDFAAQYPATLLLKGARTVIAEKNHPALFNTTGHPGMATGGMGDVLTGTCGALLAQGYTPRQTAALGAWVCGRAAEIAIFSHDQSAESLAAEDLLTNMGKAFDDLRARCY